MVSPQDTIVTSPLGAGGKQEPFVFYALEPAGYEPKPSRLGADYSVEFWSPSWRRNCPEGLELRIGRATLLLWWFYSRLSLQPNAYRICLIRRQGQIVHYSAVFRKNPRFPFMEKTDMQVGPVWTDPGERGKGLQRTALDAIVDRLGGEASRLWWLCRSSNAASNIVARKGGFQVRGRGWRKSRFGLQVAGAFRLEQV
jgi:RimJ/RimL family protein N-acetyltransferase